MIFRDIVLQFEEEPVLNRLIELYPEESKNLEGYSQVIKELKTTEPKDTTLTIDIKLIKDDDADYWDVSGIDIDSISYAIEFTPWGEWLNMQISEETLETLPLMDIYCHCLWEMTWDGYTQSEIQDKYDSIMERASEIIDEAKIEDN